jgi:hypothetical protein
VAGAVINSRDGARSSTIMAAGSRNGLSATAAMLAAEKGIVVSLRTIERAVEPYHQRQDRERRRLRQEERHCRPQLRSL